MTKYPLHPNGGEAAIKHWKEHRPKMYAELVRTGMLEEMAYNAQERTTDALARLISQGMPYDKAWESVREDWIYLPAGRADDAEPGRDAGATGRRPGDVELLGDRGG